MDDERIVISSSAAISPEAVAGKGFTTAMRGYQPAEVRQFLNKVAEELAAAVAREAELKRALQEAASRAAHPEIDEAVLTSSLGEHAGRLIASAREMAAAINAEAERTAAATLRDAEFRIARIRQEADTLMARRVDEADGVSASLRQSAEADARAIRDQAQSEAEAAIQAARSHGKEMVAEARAVRERMLGDLARRRRVAEVQLEQLRVARGRLVEAYEVVRRTLEEVTAELAAAEPEARLAAEAVGRRMADGDLPPSPRFPDRPLRTAPTAGPPPLDRRPDRTPDDPTRPTMAAFAPSPMPSPEGEHDQGSASFQPPPPPPAPMPAPYRAGPERSGSEWPGSDRTGADRPGSDWPGPDRPPADRPGAEQPGAERPGTERPPVPPAWIERAGGSVEASSGRSQPPMPPSVAPPLLVPAAGVGGGHPAEDPADMFDPADPGTWAGAGFGPPRHAGPPRPPAPGEPASPDRSGQPSPGASSSGVSSPGAVGRDPASDRGGGSPAPGGQTGSSAGSGAATASHRPTPTVPGRPPLRPQTVADSAPFRGRTALASPSAPAIAAQAGPTLTSVALRPTPPDLPRHVPPARAEQPPELATGEVTAVSARADAPAPVDELFARLRDQVPAPETAAPEATAPTGPSDDVVEEAALARRDEQLDPLEADLTRSLKRILQDEQNEVLERLRQGGPKGVASVVSALDEQTSSFTAAAAPALSAAYRAGGGVGDDTTGFALGGKLANDLAAPLRERLERVVAGGDDPEDVAEAIRAAYRQAKLQEIEQVVRHHTAAAHALGAFASTAGGTLLRWVVDDEGPCPDCYDNTLAGPTPKGEPYPTGQDHPPAHQGCRCLLVPVST